MNMKVTDPLLSLEVFAHRLTVVACMNLFADKIIGFIQDGAPASEILNVCAEIKASAEAQMADQYALAALFGFSGKAVFAAAEDFLMSEMRASVLPSPATEGSQ
jgi:hypothetical protein